MTGDRVLIMSNHVVGCGLIGWTLGGFGAMGGVSFGALVFLLGVRRGIY